MGSRLELQEKLKQFVGNGNVYFEPPEGYKMSFPCIVYKLSGADVLRANDTIHRFVKRYSVTYISTDVDEGESWRPSAKEGGLIENFLRTFEHSSFERPFKSDNKMHFVFSLYY